MAFSTLIYFKDISQDLCNDPHLVQPQFMVDPNGSAAYVVYYDDAAGLPDNATLSSIAQIQLPIFTDQLLSILAPTGKYANDVFNGTNTTDTDVFGWNSVGPQWDPNPQVCPASVLPSSNTKSFSVYYDASNNQNGDFCNSSGPVTLYYDGATTFNTIEQIIYAHSQGTITLMGYYNPMGAPNPATVSDLNDQNVTGPLGIVDLIPGEYGDLVSDFYLNLSGLSSDWNHAAVSNTQYSNITPVPSNDPGPTKLTAATSGWVPFNCPGTGALQINLNYGSDSVGFCGAPINSTYYYYTGPGGPTYSTIDDIVQHGVVLYTTSNDAIQGFYTPGYKTNAVVSGIYSHVQTYGYGYDSNLQTWFMQKITCTLVGNPEPRSIRIKVPKCDEYGPFVGLCHYPTDLVDVYYFSSSDLTLLEIVAGNTYLYNTKDAAANSNYNELITYQGFGDALNSIPSNQYFIWTGYFYLGKDIIGDTVRSDSPADLITAGYECPSITRDPKFLTETLNTGGYKKYYAFYQCSPATIGQSPNSFPVYLIDSGVTLNDSNYITDFVDFLSLNSKATFKVNDCKCVEYVHTIIANTEYEAKILLENYYDLVQFESPANLGIYSESTIRAYDDCTDCASNTNPLQYKFPLVEDAVPPTPGPNTDLEKNYKLDNVSKPLLRTNPKLSTNVKLVVDTEDRIYLDSINATQGLANSKYKKYELSPDSKYSYDLSRYYRDNETPLDSVFETKRNYSDLSVLEDYAKQIEEDYHYGTKLNSSKLYSEDFRITAPIWLDINMPKKFVIYRVEDPTPEFEYTDGSEDKITRISRMMRNSRIVKVFDLSKKTPVGKYLRSHIQDEFFPETPLTVTMQKDEKSSYNGIDLVKGGFVQKPEYIYEDFVQKDLALIEANDFITDGFRRNKIASANLINLEFMFNDVDAKDYSVNRYFGLYVDDLDSGLGEISFIKNGLVKFKDIESYLDGTDPTFAIPEYRLLQSSGVLAYARIKETFYNLDATTSYNAQRYNVAVKASDDEINSKLGIIDKGTSVRVKYNGLSGGDFNKMRVVGDPTLNDVIKVTDIKREAVRLRIISNIDGDPAKIEDKFGNYVEFNMGTTASISWANLEAAWNAINPSTSSPEELAFYDRYELNIEADSSQITSVVFRERKSNLVDNGIFVTTNSAIIGVDEIYTNVNEFVGRFRADSTLEKRAFTSDSFSLNGSFEDIAFAIAGGIRNYTDFEAYSIGDLVYVISPIQGYRLMNTTILVSNANGTDFLEVSNADSLNDLDLSQEVTNNFKAYYMNGGNSGGKSVLIDANTSTEIVAGDYLPTIYNNTYNQVLDVVEFVDDKTGQYSKVILNSKTAIKDGDYKVYAKNRMALGLFSAYDIYDMNFDFYDTSNSDLKELDLETRENMNYIPFEQASLGVGELLPENVIDDEFVKTPIDYFANLLPVLDSEDSKQITTQRIKSEYDRLNENSLKEFSTNSRVVPNINKWVLKDMFNVREEPYYLNTNEAFGKNNFSPDLTISGRDKEGYTHEWFYLDKWPEYMNYTQYNLGFSYIDFVQNFEVTKQLFTSTEHDYFDLFMVSEGHEVPVQIVDSNDPTQTKTTNMFTKTKLTKKYTFINGGNDINFASTLFKGIKFEFKSRKDGSFLNADEFVRNSEFNGYKFTTLVKINNGSTSNTIDYEFIKNDKFEFVIFFIELNIEDSFIGDYINRKYLYELQHKIVAGVDTNGQTIYKYADVNVDGALEVSAVNWSAQGPYTVQGVIHNNGSEPAFNTQMPSTSDGTFGRLKIDYGLGNDFYMDVIKVISVDQLLVAGVPYYFDNLGVKQPINPYTLPYTVQINAKYIYESGGVNAHSLLLSELAAGVVADKLANNSKDIKFTTIKEDGTVVSGKFAVIMDSGTELIKHSKLVSKIDNDTPKSYKLKKQTIGHVLAEGTEYYPFLVRHNGHYTVDFTPVVTFTDLYNFNKIVGDQKEYDPDIKVLKEPYYKINLSTNYETNKSAVFYKRYNRLGNAFNVGFISDSGQHDSDWGLIKNHFYHKVNEINPLGVTKLSETSEYLPQYPLINEIAVDKKNVNVFKSSWEDNYYTRSISGGGTEPVPGTISTLEEKSYLGSTVIKYKPSYSIYEFTSTPVASEADLDSILRNGSNKTDVVYFETDDQIIIDFYMRDLIAKVIGDDGLRNTIEKFVEASKSAGDKTTIEDDVIEYGLNNIVELYRLDDIQLFTREYKGSASTIESVSDLDIIDNGYAKDREFTYSLHGKKPLNFRLIYSKKLGYSYSIRALIKIQA